MFKGASQPNGTVAVLPLSLWPRSATGSPPHGRNLSPTVGLAAGAGLCLSSGPRRLRSPSSLELSFAGLLASAVSRCAGATPEMPLQAPTRVRVQPVDTLACGLLCRSFPPKRGLPGRPADLTRTRAVFYQQRM